MTARKKTVSDISNEIDRVPMSDVHRNNMTLNIDDQVFLIRLLDQRDQVITDNLKTFLKDIYLKDNEQLVKNVTTAVIDQVGEAISPIWQKLEDLATGQDRIEKELIREMKDVKNVLAGHEILIDKLIRSQSWWNIGLRIALAVSISLLLSWLIFHT